MWGGDRLGSGHMRTHLLWQLESKDAPVTCAIEASPPTGAVTRYLPGQGWLQFPIWPRLQIADFVRNTSSDRAAESSRLSAIVRRDRVACWQTRCPGVRAEHAGAAHAVHL